MERWRKKSSSKISDLSQDSDFSHSILNTVVNILYIIGRKVRPHYVLNSVTKSLDKLLIQQANFRYEYSLMSIFTLPDIRMCLFINDKDI